MPPGRSDVRGPSPTPPRAARRRPALYPPALLLPTLLGVACVPPAEEGEFAPGGINAVAFEGSYTCDPGIAPEIALRDDGTTKAFSAWMDQRLFTSGTWSWDGRTLRIESSAGTFAFDSVALDDGTMVLGTGDDRWDCTDRPDATP